MSPFLWHGHHLCWLICTIHDRLKSCGGGTRKWICLRQRYVLYNIRKASQNYTSYPQPVKTGHLLDQTLIRMQCGTYVLQNENIKCKYVTVIFFSSRTLLEWLHLIGHVYPNIVRNQIQKNLTSWCAVVPSSQNMEWQNVACSAWETTCQFCLTKAGNGFLEWLCAWATRSVSTLISLCQQPFM